MYQSIIYFKFVFLYFISPTILTVINVNIATVIAISTPVCGNSLSGTTVLSTWFCGSSIVFSGSIVLVSGSGFSSTVGNIVYVGEIVV